MEFKTFLWNKVVTPDTEPHDMVVKRGNWWDLNIWDLPVQNIDTGWLVSAWSSIFPVVKVNAEKELMEALKMTWIEDKFQR